MGFFSMVTSIVKWAVVKVPVAIILAAGFALLAPLLLGFLAGPAALGAQPYTQVAHKRLSQEHNRQPHRPRYEQEQQYG